MIALLSPAKTLDFNTHNACSNYTMPEFMSESEYLIGELKKYKVCLCFFIYVFIK